MRVFAVTYQVLDIGAKTVLVNASTSTVAVSKVWDGLNRKGKIFFKLVSVSLSRLSIGRLSKVYTTIKVT